MKKTLVTGATGFLGKRCSELMRERGHHVLAIGRNKEKLAKLKNMGFDVLELDLEDKENFQKLDEFDIENVVHCAALSSPWGNYESFYRANVIATENLIDYFKTKNLKRFVHISTPSVYFNHRSRFNIRELDELPLRFASHYTTTKRIAEMKLLNSFHKDRLPVIVLRPRGIFGPGDTSIIPRLIKLSDSKKLKIMGNGENIIDMTYVDNVVEAIICSVEADSECIGEIYNITNDEPIKIWDYLSEVLKDLDRAPPTKKISYSVIYTVCLFLELYYKTLRIKGEPMLTRYTAGLLALSQTLNIEKAKMKLKYAPIVNMREARKRTVQWWKNEN